MKKTKYRVNDLVFARGCFACVLEVVRVDPQYDSEKYHYIVKMINRDSPFNAYTALRKDLKPALWTFVGPHG